MLSFNESECILLSTPTDPKVLFFDNHPKFLLDLVSFLPLIRQTTGLVF